ncbi:DNA-binding transcriptional regulator, LysR family [Terribacillus halophilus]|uniref:DNA-binding transcriptional regulator, LysR family n=1 Tax=Terribacillus halophilus TaxID=361279 RepID=A0A1G6U4H5_9BACI|nr:LysR family transcriptional regulator [Terribacillus halophilus]SDD35445.1 DNA-binding transcriptional regulator, LysR family [Terribacillus halophilus]
MEWEQLEYFQTLAREQHVTRAAQLLSITQPALSRSINRLESQIGTPLFDRQGRTIKLNKYGELLLKRVDLILKEFEEGKNEIQSLLDPDKGEISLGFLHTLGTTIVPNIIGAFKEKYPQVRFHLKQNHSNWLLDNLQSGDLDLCLLSSFPMESNIAWTPLWQEELFLFFPKNHPLAKKESITLKEVADEPFILMEEGYALRVTIDSIFEQVGIRPKIMFEGEEVTTIAGFVGAGMGISILPDVKSLDQMKIAKVRISSPKCERTIGIASMEGKFLSPIAEKFMQYIVDHFQ